MQKPIALATSVALFFTGCQTKSPTWQKVMATPRSTGDAEARDRAYAGELHQRLGATPHKVVTYEFDYSSKFNGPQTGQRTSVVYFDETNPRQPWWLMDQTLDKPVWVPNEPLHRQVAFFGRRPARIVEVHDYTVTRDKRVQEVERARRPVGTSTLQRARHAEPVQTVAPVPVKARVTSRVEEPREPKPRWRFWGKSPKKEPAVSHLEPAVDARPEKTKPERSLFRTEKKTRPSDAALAKEKAAAVPKSASKADPEKRPAVLRPVKAPAVEVERPKEKAKPATPQNEISPEAAPKREEKAPAERPPKKRPPLFNRENDEPPPAAPAGDAAADRPRRNLFQRILGSLNPVRWFRKTA